MLASVIVPVYRNWTGLSACLDGLASQELDPKDFEIVIVNNDPADPLPAGFALPQNAVYVEESARGSYAARNAGISVSRAPILCFTDSDCVPSRKWLRIALEAFDENASIGRVGGPVRLTRPDRGNTAQHYDFLFSFSQEQEVFEHGWAVTANMCARRVVFDEVGSFDPSMYSGGDAEWGIRAMRNGWPIEFLPEAVVQHGLRSTMAEVVTKERRIAGGVLSSRIRKRGRARIVAGSLLVMPLRVLPSIRATVRIFKSEDVTVLTKIKIGMLLYLVRLVRQFEIVRILVFGCNPERR
jgi:GT2 family glycosyltransferase